MPQTPDAPGLHRKRLNGVYYIDDKAATPADVHHQRGMHCVDCHTAGDTMGDGFLYKRMEDAVEIRCESCHGNWDAYATFLTKRHNKLPHLSREGDDVFLTSRVTGKKHRVKQVRDVVRPGSPDYNARAALAMTGDHANLECYTCHSGWNPNFFGFHFDRNESFTQLDILSGSRTDGRVTTLWRSSDGLDAHPANSRNKTNMGALLIKETASIPVFVQLHTKITTVCFGSKLAAHLITWRPAPYGQ